VSAHSGAHPDPCAAAVRVEATMASNETTVESVFLAVMIPPSNGLGWCRAPPDPLDVLESKASSLIEFAAGPAILPGGRESAGLLDSGG